MHLSSTGWRNTSVKRAVVGSSLTGCAKLGVVVKVETFGYELRFLADEEQEETGKIYKEIEKFEKILNKKLKKERTKKKGKK